MDRRIDVKITGEYVRKDNKNAGVQGEGNVTTLHIELSEDWSGFSKRLIWRDATGENPVAILLYKNVSDLEAEPLIFETLIPKEPLAKDGWCSFTVEGYLEGEPNKISKSVTDRLRVYPSDTGDGANAPEEPTPSQAQQLQGEIDKILPQVKAEIEKAVGSVSYGDLSDLPAINGVTLQGNQTSEDLQIAPDKHYTHRQSSASAVWLISHGLNKFPAVTVVDSAGSIVIGNIQYLTADTLQVTFSSEFSGTAYCN